MLDRNRGKETGSATLPARAWRRGLAFLQGDTRLRAGRGTSDESTRRNHGRRGSLGRQPQTRPSVGPRLQVKTLEADQWDELKKKTPRDARTAGSAGNCSFPSVLFFCRVSASSERATREQRPRRGQQRYDAPGPRLTHTTQECRTAHRGKSRRHQTGRVTG